MQEGHGSCTLILGSYGSFLGSALAFRLFLSEPEFRQITAIRTHIGMEEAIPRLELVIEERSCHRTIQSRKLFN